MEPGIGRSLREGFHAANRSWAGMGVVAGAWILTIGVLLLFLLITNPPWEALQQQLARQATPAMVPTTEPALPINTTPADAPSSKTAPEPAAEPVLTTPQTTTPTATDAATAPAASPSSAPKASAPTETPTAPAVVAPRPVTPPPQAASTASPAEVARTRAIDAWVGRAWPVFLLGFLLIMTVTLWLQGGKIGYLNKRINGQPAVIADFWTTGVRAFGPLVVTSLLSLVATIVLVVISGLVVWGLSLLPSTLGLIIGLLLTVALGIGLVWLLVRLTFWIIAIVIDGLGPIAGLRASVRATQGHGWKIIGLIALFILLFMTVGLGFTLVDWMGNRVGGAVGVVITQTSAILQLMVTNLYGSFAMTAALICYYDDLKAPTATATSPVQVS